MAVAGKNRCSWGISGVACAYVSYAAIVVLAGSFTYGDGALHLTDSGADAVPRPTDPGADTPFDPRAHRLIDLREIVIGTWFPDDPEVDLFMGAFESVGQSDPEDGFFRLDLTIDGLVNPPGRSDPLAFDPFEYGDNPVYGFVEIDMDNDVHTGGELRAPQYRYLGNVARFGGKPAREEFYDRVALDASAFDDDFNTPPFVERHGEEFHLALFGGAVDEGRIIIVEGDGDSIFESGETWLLTGSFFHRAHGFEEFTVTEGGQTPGEYAPQCTLQFLHDPVEDVTHVSLVFPLTNLGAGLAKGEDPESLNQDPSDQASVLEALDDLQFSALLLRLFPTGLPEEELITAWADRDPIDHLETSEWEITALLGTSYTQPDPSGFSFVWTDVYPDIALGDFDGSGDREDADTDLIAEFVSTEDGSDGVIDGRVVISAFALDFSVFDVNYDGVVDLVDSRIEDTDGDTDDDDDLDLADFASFQQCFSESLLWAPECATADVGGNGWIDLDDLIRFAASMTGPEED